MISYLFNIIGSLSFCLLTIVACQSTTENKSGLSDIRYPYFCIDEFIDDYISSDSAYHVEKIIDINSLSEKKEFSDYSIISDLQEFRGLSLCHPKYLEQYHVDTLSEENGEQIYLYKALLDKLTLKEMQIRINREGGVKSIRIMKNQISSVLSSYEEYILNPKTGYSKSQCDSLSILGSKCRSITINYLR